MRRKNLTEFDERVEKYFQNARSRAKKENVKFNLTREYIATIMTSYCPVFNTMFDWTPNLNSKRENNFSSPELDKVFSEDGYLMGNVVFICHEANRIKDKGTMDQHYAIADFMHEIEKKQKENPDYAKQKELASIPADIYKPRKNNSEHGPLFATGAGEDSDDTDNHSGTIHREDIDHCTEEGGGDSMGYRGEEVGPLETSKSIEDNWQLHPTYGWLER
jgi:hypothetical protein